MTINEIKNLLSPLITTLIDHETTNQVVNLPYVVILEMGSMNSFADNSTYFETHPIQLILHQSNPRNLELEANIKTLLKNNHIPYEVNTEWDSSNYLYITTFDANGIY